MAGPWSAPLTPGGGNASGTGGQPLVQPNGTVIVPVVDRCTFNGVGLILDYESTNGGASWTAPLSHIIFTTHTVAGPMRAVDMPSAQMDQSGRLYVAWQDCQFRTGCSSNDIVYSTTTDGVQWTPVTRIPIDARTSTVDHFIPTFGVTPATSGTRAHLAATYYSFPKAKCTYLTCRLEMGYVSSADGGAHWSHPMTLAGPMSLTWLAATSQGFMVGDYAGMAFVDGTPHAVFAAARPPINGHFRESMYTWTGLRESARDLATVASGTGLRPSTGPLPTGLSALPPLTLH